MKEKHAKCRSCGSAIRWIKMESGKYMPCDWAPVNYKPAGDGELVTLVTPDGKIVRGVQDWSSPECGYTSHFATCPNAAEHRRR